MRQPILSALLLPLLAACGTGPGEQTPEQIRAELARIPAPKAGLWEAHFTLTDFAATGVPDEAGEALRREMEARGRLGQITCLTEAAAKTAVEEGLVRYEGGFCQIQALHVGDNAFEARLSCETTNNTVATVELSGPLEGDVSHSQTRVEAKLKDKPDASVRYALDQVDRFKGACPAA